MVLRNLFYSLFIKKIQKEFDDLLSRTLGRVVKQLTVSLTLSVSKSRVMHVHT